MRWLVIIWIGISLLGCSMPQSKSESGRTGTDRAIHTDLIRGLISSSQYYAALAHIDDERKRNGESDELRALRGDALAALGRTAEADALYRLLLRGSYAAEGYHGLGLLHVQKHPDVGIGYLRSAVAQRPASAQWRNDLGYALMSNGRLKEALTELATATELDPGTERYRNNLVILLILMKDETRIARLRQQWSLRPDTLGELRRQAQAVRAQMPPERMIR